MIRRAVLADVDKLMVLCEEHYRMVNMDKRGYGAFDEEVSRNTLIKYLTNPEMFCVFVNDDYNGVIGFMVTDNPYSVGKVAFDILWYARSKRLAIRLFNVMEHFCDMLHVKKVSVGIPSFMGQSVKKFLSKRGYEETDITMGRRF